MHISKLKPVTLNSINFDTRHNIVRKNKRNKFVFLMKTYSRIFFAHNKSDSFFAKVDQGELGTVIPTCPV